jgi:hypothetical protein
MLPTHLIKLWLLTSLCLLQPASLLFPTKDPRAKPQALQNVSIEYSDLLYVQDDV